MKHNIDDFDAVLFGDFGVLTNTPFIDGKPLAMLSGRVEYLAHLREERVRRGLPELKYAVMGNKGGVAFGKQTETEATEEVRWTAEQIGAQAFAVCFAHPTPLAGFEQYAAPALLANRKPEPGMIWQLVEKLGVPKEKILVVGNYADDCRAAKAAGIAYEITGVFFSQADRYAASVFVARAEQCAAVAMGLSVQQQEELGPVDDFDPFQD